VVINDNTEYLYIGGGGPSGPDMESRTNRNKVSSVQAPQLIHR